MADTEVVRVTPLGADSTASWAIVRLRTTEPLHIHEKSDITVTLLEGGGIERMGAGESQTVRVVHAGDVVRIPRGYPHAYENTARGVSTALVVFEPPAVAGDMKPVPLPAVRRPAVQGRTR